MPKLKEVVIGILIAFIIIISAIGACIGVVLFPNTLVEIAAGTTPQAKVSAYCLLANFLGMKIPAIG